MTIAKEELVKLAKRGFALCKAVSFEEKQRGYYALCFCFGSEKAHVYSKVASGLNSTKLLPNLEQELLNSIND